MQCYAATGGQPWADTAVQLAVGMTLSKCVLTPGAKGCSSHQKSPAVTLAAFNRVSAYPAALLACAAVSGIDLVSFNEDRSSITEIITFR